VYNEIQIYRTGERLMSKKHFTEKEVRMLSRNPHVKSVSEKAITYTDEFKQLFIKESEKGRFARDIFESCGFDTNVLGIYRIKNAAERWKNAYRKEGILGLRDTRGDNSGRPRDRELTAEEKCARLEAQNKLLMAEVELLKKIRFMERGMKK